ncbi:hypothetical protein CHS0354_030894 [Potamilus streckersoni]|uniref:BTB domain-containing protein n=1 Tax=Potamilus streckersoni TaxID=2493646 RepID=A0AAE0VRU7_9BIVA|nr:hypothetical protein CHS0354_030894 [Potamilus streckersoni]
MARPREKTSLLQTSAVFQHKCSAEQEKLQQLLALQLRKDLCRLFEEEIYTDLVFHIKGQDIKAHKFILKARSRQMYEKLVKLSTCPNDSVLTLDGLDPATVRDFLRKLYTKDNASNAVEEFDEYLNRVMMPGLESCENKNDLLMGLCNVNIEEIQSNHKQGQDSHVVGDDGSVINEYKSQENAISENNFSQDLRSNNIYMDQATVCDNDLQSGDDINLIRNVKDEVNIMNIIEKDTDETKRDVAGNLQTAAHQRSSQTSDGETSAVEMILKGMKSESPDIQNLEQSKNCLKHETADITEMPADDIKRPNNGINDSSLTHNINIPKKEWKENSEWKNTLHIEENQERSEGDKSSLSEIIKLSYNIKVPYVVCSQLGEDLLRAFLQEVDCDCNVSVMRQEFLTHRCIMAARSTYFEAMLGGGWIESDAGSITLEGITPGVMEQSLLYLYGGVSEVNESCTLGELIMIADMYGMEGLKEIVSFNLRKEYCHFFHRPCAGCIAGVPETLTLAMMYNLEDLNQKCVKWISKHMAKVWPTKSFGYLPQEVLEYCCNHAILELSVDNVVEVMLNCRILNDKTPHLKWTETIFDMIIRLMDATIEFSSQHFLDIITSKMFRDIDKQGMACNLGILEDIFGSVIRSLSPEVACQTYLSLHRWQEAFRSPDGNGEKQVQQFSEDFENFVRALFTRCENHLKLYIHQAAHTAEWDLLTKEMQTSLMKAANYVCIDNTNRGRVAPPKLTSMQKRISATSLLSLKEYFDQHFVCKYDRKSKAAINQDSKTQERSVGSQAYSIERKQKSAVIKGQTTHLKSYSARPKTTDTGSLVFIKQDSAASSADKQRQLFVKSGNQSQSSHTASLPQTKVKQQRQLGNDTRTGRLSAEGQIKQCFGQTKPRNTSKRIENQMRFASDTELSKNNLVKSKQNDLPSNESTGKLGDVQGDNFEDDEKHSMYRKRSLSVDATTFVQPNSSEIRISESMINNFTNGNQSISTLPKLLPMFDVQFSVPQEHFEDF